MKVLISGASGLIGSALRQRLESAGHPIGRLVRSTPNPDPEAREVFWDPGEGKIDAVGIEGYEGVVHLAGETIAAGRWDEATKQRILDSRVKGTSLLAETLAKLHSPPRVLVCASGSSYYGSRGDEVVTEETPIGKGFLPEVCRAWEGAADRARACGIRVVHLRFGMVLSPKGGALAKMLPPFKLGVAGKIGRGDQYMPWITLDDAVRVIEFALLSDRVKGCVNAVSPNPVMNEEFTRTLGRALSRPTLFTMPMFAARLLFGEMAEELLLASCRAMPKRLVNWGFSFEHPEIEEAFRHVLKEDA